MSRDKSKNTTGTAFQLQGFLRVTLTAKQKLEAQHTDPSAGMGDWLGELLQHGYKFSVSYDDAGKCFYATLTDVGVSSSLRGWALSGRGPTAVGAIQMLCAKHYTVLGGDWTKGGGAEDDGWG